MPDEELAFLELLAKRALPPQFEELVQRARRDGTAPEELARLHRAKELALRIHELAGRRERRETGLSALVDTARDLAERHELDTLLRAVVRRARLLLHVDMAYISLNDQERGDTYVRTADGTISALTEGFRVPETQGIGAASARNRAPVWTSDYLNDDRIPHSDLIDTVVREEGLSAILAVPLRCADQVIGVLYTADRTARSFTTDEVSLMASLADHAAAAIEHARVLDEARDSTVRLTEANERLREELRADRRLAEIFQGMTELVVCGGDLQALTQLLAELLSAAVLVRDASDLALAHAGELPKLDEDELARAALDARAEHRVVPVGGTGCVTRVNAGLEHLGTLLVHRQEPLTEQELRILQHAARETALLVLVDRGTAVAEHQGHDEVLDELLTVPLRSTRRLRERAQRLGMDLDRPHVLAVLRPEGGEQRRAVMWASAYASRIRGVKSVRDGCLVLLIPGDDPDTAVRAVTRELSRVLGHPVTGGSTGPRGGPESVAGMYVEAVRCLDALTAMGLSGTASSSRKLGFVGMLLADNRDVDGFLDTVLGPVIAYDAERSTELVSTLEAYFGSGSKPTYAAETLHVHPNTVSRRLERISELLGADWQQPGPALEIQLALRLLGTRNSLRGRVRGEGDQGS
ncbi:helix-turn-helix domain-containing protein [Streptomyces sp. W16]|uniref:helix-turn-helix domain-containing protein n=1 Tax=Streptomyces sp. W16 TaxID=3076631 RepID=UPI00295C01E1|nr:GAF domain-containing protein [Streptomyces sp. W16]MDV9169070.1 helix-turn-helix domain-containing protein [Streptomyces sp. W16]